MVLNVRRNTRGDDVEAVWGWWSAPPPHPPPPLPFEAVFTDPQLPHLEGGSPRWKAKLEKYRSSHLSGWIRGRLTRCQERLTRLAGEDMKARRACPRARVLEAERLAAKWLQTFQSYHFCGELGRVHVSLLF